MWARDFKEAILDLHWDANKTFFYDFNTTSGTRTPFYTAAGYFPLWQNITPPGLTEDQALRIVSGTRYLIKKYDGPPTAATYLISGLNWDFPNVWPPHVYTTIKGIEALDRALHMQFAGGKGAGNTTTPVGNSTATNGTNGTGTGIGLTQPPVRTLAQLSISNFSQVAPGQLGMNETQLPAQPAQSRGNVTYGNATQHLLSAEAGRLPWTQGLMLEIATRYLDSAFCSWYSTGGQLNGTLQRLPLSELNASGTYHEEPGVEGGKMFEKFNVTDLDAAGGGGEYTVQVGFGWTNGVVLWAAHKFGQYLHAPTCPLILITPNGNATTTPGGAGQNSTGTGGTGQNSTGTGGTGQNITAVPGPASSAAPPPGTVTSTLLPPSSAAAPPTSAAAGQPSSPAPSQLNARNFLFVGRRVHN